MTGWTASERPVTLTGNRCQRCNMPDPTQDHDQTCKDWHAAMAFAEAAARAAGVRPVQAVDLLASIAAAGVDQPYRALCAVLDAGWRPAAPQPAEDASGDSGGTGDLLAEIPP